MTVDCQTLAKLECRPAQCRGELEASFRLVYGSYVERGYLQENATGMRLTVFNALPEATTFVAVLEGCVIATVTVVADSPVGLPMDEIYEEELNVLRGEGRKLAEITMLADRRHTIERSLGLITLLFKRTFDLATLVLGADDAVITINPRHDVYYERRLLFTSMGEPKSYPSVRDNPALAKRLDLRTFEERCANKPLLQKHYFTNRTPKRLLRRAYDMSPDDLRYFFIEKTDIFRRAPEKAMAYLRKVRPDCPWSEWGLQACRRRCGES